MGSSSEMMQDRLDDQLALVRELALTPLEGEIFEGERVVWGDDEAHRYMMGWIREARRRLRWPEWVEEH